MSGTVLLALDGSGKDERGIALAVAFAELAGASVHVVRVMSVPEALPVGAGMLAVLDGIQVSRDEIQAELDGVASQIRTLSSDSEGLTSEVIEGNDVAMSVLHAAEVRDARAIVIATRAAGTVGRTMHGSVADKILRKSARPVLLVPPRTDDMAGKRVHLRRALVPFDGSRASLHVIDHLLELERVADLELVLLQVVSSGSAEDVSARLSRVAERMRERGARTEETVIEYGDPASVIIGAVRDELVDLIAMSTRGQGGVKRMVLGSVATRVSRESEVPVLLVTPKM